MLDGSRLGMRMMDGAILAGCAFAIWVMHFWVVVYGESVIYVLRYFSGKFLNKFILDVDFCLWIA